MAIKLADAFIEVLLDYAKAEKDADKMDKTIGGITSGTMTKMGAAMTAAGAAITGTLGIAANSAADFGKNLANVSTLGVTDLGALDEGTRDLAVKFGIDLNDAMKATYETISAGIPEDAAIMVMEQAARGAQAGVGSLGDALDLGTSVMNAWNMQGKNATETASNMEKIMGMAATAAFKGKTTFAEMATSIGQVAPVMSAAGISTDEFFGAVSALTSTGKPTSSAMLQLQQAVSNIIKPSKEASDLADQLGIEFNATALESKGLAGFLDSVKEATGGNIEQMGVLFGSVEALGAALSLTGPQADLFKESIKEMGSASEILSRMSDEFVKNNPKLALDQAKAALQELFIMIGRTVIPALSSLAKAATPVMQFLSDFIQNHPMISTGIGTIAGVIGVLALAIGSLMLVFGPLLAALPALAGAGGLAGIASAFTGAGAAAAGLAGAGGLGAVIAALGGFAAAALPVLGLATIIAGTFVATAPVIASTAKSYWDLAQSNNAVSREAIAYAEHLSAQGVALDVDAIKRMNHAEKITTINNALIAQRESDAAREIQTLTGVDATRQQIHIAELARVGLGVSAQQAAAMAVKGITQAEIQDMMAKGQLEQQVITQGIQAKTQAAAVSSQLENQGRTDKTASIGVFQWAADKEAAMLAKAAELKNADFYQRKTILRDLAAMEAEKANAERKWAMDNQALTASEIAGMQYKVQAKEAADARYIAISQGTMKAEKDQLYVNLSDQVATIKVHGDAITRQKQQEAEQRKKMAEMIQTTEKNMETQLGKDKSKAINDEISQIQKLGEFKKLSEEQIAMFKQKVMKGDIDASIQYWQNLSAQANQGYVNSLDQYKAFSAQMQAEAMQLRKTLAYAVNPNQTGSPSLNMEMAAGFQNTINIFGGFLGAAQTMIGQFRQNAVTQLNSLGAGLVGSLPMPSQIYGGGAAPAQTSGSGDSSTTSNATITNNVTVTTGSGNPIDIASAIKKTLNEQMAHSVKKHARAKGVRSPGVHRVPTIPGVA